MLIRATSAALVAGLLVAACGEEQSSASCGDAVRYDGVTLVGAEVDLVEPLPPATGTREATRGGCGGDSRTVVLDELKGVPPTVALADREPAASGTARLYVRRGTFTAVRGHPLHRSLYGSAAKPRFSTDRCRPATLRGRLGEPPVTSTDFVLRQGERTQPIRVEARTRLRLRSAGGVGYAERGERLRVRVVRCGPGRRPVARVVARG